ILHHRVDAECQRRLPDVLMADSATTALAAALNDLAATPEAAVHGALLLVDHLTLVDAAADARAAAPGEDLAEAAALDAELGALAGRDDVHWGRLVHPGAIVWPTVLAHGSAGDVPGTTLLRAAVIGYETCVLLTGALDDSLRPALHATTATGVIA